MIWDNYSKKNMRSHLYEKNIADISKQCEFYYIIEIAKVSVLLCNFVAKTYLCSFYWLYLSLCFVLMFIISAELGHHSCFISAELGHHQCWVRSSFMFHSSVLTEVITSPKMIGEQKPQQNQPNTKKLKQPILLKHMRWKKQPVFKSYMRWQR